MSNDWGDEEPGIEAQPYELDERDEPGGELPERESGRLFGIDIADVANALAGPAIRAVVQKAITGAVKDAVQAEVDEALDPSVVEELHARAATAARRAVTAAMNALDEEPADEEPTLYYGSLDEFVREYLVKNYRRRVDGERAVWAADWWNYPEATIRLDALWRAWEHLRLDPATGASVWLRDHADHHMSVLLDPHGPFAAAGLGKDRMNTNDDAKGAELPYTAPPTGLF
ncbi:DUF4913 domain-containing protein [Microbacterium kunmingense]|uniref:DUF4913 domain-containing protein n=1 Tax=Microbacterium kunmingense TaxID=2915939 RepID=UPI0027E2CEC6|nr:DUF4913 domain-containing protein [Microbacterium kunmingense]